jgi:hypothetical protein
MESIYRLRLNCELDPFSSHCVVWKLLIVLSGVQSG